MARFDPARNTWRITATVKGDRNDRHRVVRSFDAPNTRAGQKAAELAEARLRVEVADKAEASWPGATAGGTGTFAAIAQAWVERNARRWSPKTTRETKYQLKHYILPTLGATPLADVTVGQVEDLYAAWEDHGRAASSARRWHGIIAAVFAEAVRRGDLKGPNPMDRVKAAGSQAPEREHVLSAAELGRALDAAPSDAARAYFEVAADTGARRGTMVALRWRNVDLDAATVTFRRAIAIDEDNVEVEKETKAKRAYAVHIAGDALDALRDHRKRALETAGALGLFGRFDDLFVFSSDGGQTHWDLGWPSHAWTKATRKAGVRSQGLHDLRHYAATAALTAGGSTRAVADRLGCTEANILRTYSHSVPASEDARIAELMAGMRRSASRAQA
jgi:integrase